MVGRIALIWIPALLIVAALVFPPWAFRYGGRYLPMGYRPIFMPRRGASIDTPILLVEIAIVCALTGAVVLTLRARRI